MIFLSLFLELLLLLGGGRADFAALDNGVGQAAHTIHGHLPGPSDGHAGTSHLHHGQHGHLGGTSGHDVFH